jgi:hypothetical protein
MHGAIGKLGQYCTEGTITLAGFTRVLLAYTFIVAQRHDCASWLTSQWNANVSLVRAAA